MAEELINPNTERLREDLVHPDPLLDCVLEMCRQHGVGASRASLAAGLPLEHGRLTLGLAERAATRVGMAARVQRLALTRIDTVTLPAILILKANHACVLLGWEPVGDTIDGASAKDGSKRARVLFPETGQGAITLPFSDLQSRYTGVVLFVRPHFRLDYRRVSDKSRRDEHWFWSAVLRQKLVYRDVLWAAFLINVFALAFPLFSMNVYDRVVPNHAVETLWALAIGVVLVISADLSMRMLRGRFVDEASARIDIDISASLMERVLGIQLAHRPASVGSFASNLRGFEQVRDFIASSTVTALIDLPFALLFVLVMLWISPWMTIPVVLAFMMMVVGGYVLQYRLHTLSVSTYQASAHRNGLLIESLTGIETIKCQGAEGVIQTRWERANRYLAALGVQMRGLSTSAQYATGWLQQIVSVVTIVIGVYLIGQRELTMGGLIAVSMLASRALAPSAQLVGLLMQYQGARTAMGSLDELMDKPVERPTGSSFVHRTEIKGDIEFRNVKFRYPSRNDAALDSVSFKITQGDRIAIVGKVGSGKTTLQKLILGLYGANDGAVLIDGIDIRQIDPADLRRNIGYVSQDVMLFSGSLRENITFGMPYADDLAVVQAAEVAGLSAFVNRHPQGFDMPVGERGEGLSGGQRQSVGLARAVLHNAPILLLDEPTSAMDFSTEAFVSAKVSEFAHNKTVVLVTHRTSMLQWVNRVIVIDQGKVVADGPRDRIMEALQAGRIAKAT